MTRLRARYDPAALAGAAWTLWALDLTRRRLRREGLRAEAPAPPPRLPARAGIGLEFVLRRRPSTCLERALVRQRWLAAQGDAPDLVIGVERDGEIVRAHAWLDDERRPDALAHGYAELLRRSSP